MNNHSCHLWIFQASVSYITSVIFAILGYILSFVVCKIDGEVGMGITRQHDWIKINSETLRFGFTQSNTSVQAGG